MLDAGANVKVKAVGQYGLTALIIFVPVFYYLNYCYWLLGFYFLLQSDTALCAGYVLKMVTKIAQALIYA